MTAFATASTKIEYPDSDGQRMADNTLQFDWISVIKWNTEAYFRDDPSVFVAGDHLIYPVEGDNLIRQAPDVYVAFGRPKGYRGSYLVWEEAQIFPQVIFEIWSPGNRTRPMQKKFEFYDRFGAEEYYIIYPQQPCEMEGWLRRSGRLRSVPEMHGFRSPRLGLRFELQDGQLQVYGPDGRELVKPDEIASQRDTAEKLWHDAEQQRQAAEKQRLAADKRRLAAEQQRQDAERQRQVAEEQRQLAEQKAARLAARLRELGGDPELL